jgi:hypothetical protein
VQTGQLESLLMPTFLHGTVSSVQKKARAEGQRCAEQYLRDGSVPAARELLRVPSGEIVVAHELVDLQHDRPAWRLYLAGHVTDSLCEALDWKNSRHVSNLFEKTARESAWGALYFAVSQEAPRSAERMALRLEAVLRFWETLGSHLYLFSTLNAALSLEELMVTSCGWVLDAWGPKEDSELRMRMERAAERMARATRADSLEPILRQLPRALASARGLEHLEELSDPAFVRARLATLGSESFERVSGACPADLLGQLHDWDHELAGGEP